MNEFEFTPEPEAPAPSRVVMPAREKVGKRRLTTMRRKQLKRKLILFVVVLGIFLAGITYGTYKVNEWFNTHTIKWQSPVQTPVWVEPRAASAEQDKNEIVHDAHAAGAEINFEGATFISKTETPEPKPQPVAGQRPTIEQTVAIIYRLESSEGKNDPCKKSGRYNGYGFAPGTCYSSHAEVTALVTKWVKARQDMPLAKMLCGYNLGFQSENLKDCMNQSAAFPYYRDFLSYL